MFQGSSPLCFVAQLSDPQKKTSVVIQQGLLMQGERSWQVLREVFISKVWKWHTSLVFLHTCKAWSHLYRHMCNYKGGWEMWSSCVSWKRGHWWVTSQSQIFYGILLSRDLSTFAFGCVVAFITFKELKTTCRLMFLILCEAFSPNQLFIFFFKKKAA